MAIYLYRCKNCGEYFECDHSIKEELPKDLKCDLCGGELFRVVTGGTGVIWKCSGQTR